MSKWYYQNGGSDHVYQSGSYIYSKNGKALFYVSNNYWYEGSKAVYYLSGKWVYEIGGSAAYYSN